MPDNYHFDGSDIKGFDGGEEGESGYREKRHATPGNACQTEAQTSADYCGFLCLLFVLFVWLLLCLRVALWVSVLFIATGKG